MRDLVLSAYGRLMTHGGWAAWCVSPWRRRCRQRGEQELFFLVLPTAVLVRVWREFLSSSSSLLWVVFSVFFFHSCSFYPLLTNLLLSNVWQPTTFFFSKKNLPNWYLRGLWVTCWGWSPRETGSILYQSSEMFSLHSSRVYPCFFHERGCGKTPYIPSPWWQFCIEWGYIRRTVYLH